MIRSPEASASSELHADRVRRDGRADQDWLEAEREIRNR
ncbi:MAG: DUF2934 domain-containing protein [Terriglobales bacterium]